MFEEFVWGNLDPHNHHINNTFKWLSQCSSGQTVSSTRKPLFLLLVHLHCLLHPEFPNWCSKLGDTKPESNTRWNLYMVIFSPNHVNLIFFLFLILKKAFSGLFLCSLKLLTEPAAFPNPALALEDVLQYLHPKQAYSLHGENSFIIKEHWGGGKKPLKP